MDELNKYPTIGYESEDTYDELPEVEETQIRYAGFWLRVGAYLIDIIIIACINGILLSPLLFINNGFPIDISLWTLNGLIAIVIYYVYFSIMTKLFQQTIGKMIVGIKVIGEIDGELSWMDIFYREIVGRLIHNVFFILKLLYLAVAFSDEKQGIHDMIGNTRVVYI